MRVILEIDSGQATGRKVYLRDGEALRVGRTEWSDVAIPEDGQLSGEHFSLECQSLGCFIRDLGSTNGTLLNGQRVTEQVRVQHGDQITAGMTQFTISIEGSGGVASDAAPAAQPGQHAQHTPAVPAPGETRQTTVVNSTASPQPSTQPAPSPAPAPQRALEVADLCAKLQLGDAAKALLQPGQKPLDFLKVLIGKQLFTDAVGFWSLALPVQSAVLWASHCVRQALGEEISKPDAAALEAAEQWALEPSEEHRRLAEAAAEATQFETPAGWVAISAFWSGGSIAPAGLPEVPPAEGLAAKGVAGAIMMAATGGPAEDVLGRYQRFLEKGIEVGERSAAD